MKTGNEMPETGVTNEVLNGLFARQVEAAQRRMAAEQAREQWPGLVDRVLAKLTRRSNSHDATLASIEARIAVLEAAMSAGRG